MELDGQEKRIRQLFSDISHVDERFAPGFAGVLESAGAVARSQKAYRFRTTATLSVVGAAVVLLAIVVARHARTQTPVVPDQPSTAQESPALVAEVHVATPVKRVAKRARHRKSPDDFVIAAEPLLAWQSPTASLLKTPNEALLTSLPRLDESLQVLKSLSPDRLN